MSESSGASFPGFGSEEVCNLLATETVTGFGETPHATCIQADQGELLNRQGSMAVPPWGDSRPVQANLIRDLLREELRRGLGRRSHRSERESSLSSSSSQEGSRLSPSRLFRCHARAPSRSHHSRSPLVGA